MKKILLGVLMALVLAGSAAAKIGPYTQADIPWGMLNSLSGGANWGISNTTQTTLPYFSAPSGISETAIVLPASTASTNGFQFNYRIPANYKQFGQFGVTFLMAGAADTTCKLECDVQVQSLNSVTNSAVVTGNQILLSSLTSTTAAWTTAILNNPMGWGYSGASAPVSLTTGTVYYPNELLNVTIFRAAGTTSACWLADVYFRYIPFALEPYTWWKRFVFPGA